MVGRPRKKPVRKAAKPKVARRPANGKRGQPAFAPTDQNRLTVERRALLGWPASDIAHDLGISRGTLEKHFKKELRLGRVKRKGELDDLMWDQARRGSVAAIKALQAKADAADAEESFLGPQKPVEEKVEKAPRAPKLGKKEIRQAAADAVGGPDSSWGNDLDPMARPN